jgi:hypothetical protein
MTKMATPRRTTTWLLLLSTALALGCGDDDDPRVTIDSPENNATFTLADDLDPDAEGVQLDVSVSVTNVSEGEEVWLYTDAGVLMDDPSATPDLTQPTDADGGVVFRVTLANGVHDLLACVQDCQHRSQQITVSVSDACAGIAFVDPTPVAGDSLVLGPDDDVVSEECGVEFGVDVQVVTTAADGTSLQLINNGTPGPTTSASGGIAIFEDVVLGNRGSETPNTLAVRVEETDGSSCTQPFPNDIYVDCMGTSCDITLPDTDRTVLNQDDDVSTETGFQADFEVTADLDSSGESVNLIVDGTVLTATSGTRGDSAVAEFAAIDLSEGRHSVVAECFDSLGNATRTDPAEWIVDTIGCDISVDEPVADALFIDDDDIDESTAGIQITTSGTVSGTACESVAAGPCDAGSATDVPLSGDTFSGPATLASAPAQELCVTVYDDAGNETEARVPLRVRTDAPQLQIDSPTSGTQVNVDGTDGALADLAPASDTCEVAFTVYCTDVDVDVELIDAGSTDVLATANCDPMSGLPAPFLGQATFSMASIPSFDNGSSVDVAARSEVDRVVGTSAPVEIIPDCRAPALTFLAPTCPSVLRPSSDDSDTTTDGFQFDLEVLNPTANQSNDVTFTAVGSGGGTVLDQTTSTRVSEVTVLRDADLGSGGELVLTACATDISGNTGCTPDCDVTVAELPVVNLLEPLAGAMLNASDDCSAAPGMQIAISGTTDAPDSSPAAVEVGSLAPQAVTIVGGTVSACVDAEDGDDIAVRLTVTGADGTGSAQVRVTIDSAPPTETIDDLSLDSIVDRRGGVARLQWTAVADTDGTGLSTTEVRCSEMPIDSEGRWNNADIFWSGAAPSPGTLVAQDVSGFKVGEELSCAVRSMDAGGGITPLGPALAVLLPFEVQVIEHPSSSGIGYQTAGVGDVDGDLLNDLITVGADGKAYLYFGRTTLGPASEEPDVVIDGGSGAFTPEVLDGVGDFNADGLSDFILGSTDNSAYVFFGRPDRLSWGTSTVVVTASTCPTSSRVLCLRGESPGDFFGYSVKGVGDFDGDSVDDIAIGAGVKDGATGAVYIVRGSPSYGSSMAPAVTALPGFVVTSATGTDFKEIGRVCASPGDVTSDGRSDLFISAIGNVANAVNSEVRYLRGRAYTAGSGLQSIEWDMLDQVYSGAPGSAFSVTSVGDVTGGGSPDIAISTTGARTLQILTGESSYGSAITVEDDLSTPSDGFAFRVGEGLHAALAGFGRVHEGTGMSLLTSTRRVEGAAPGAAYLFSSTISNATVRTDAGAVLAPPLAGSESASQRVADYVGDVNGDGWPDIAIGDPDWPDGTSGSRGRVVLYY